VQLWCLHMVICHCQTPAVAAVDAVALLLHLTACSCLQDGPSCCPASPCSRPKPAQTGARSLQLADSSPLYAQFASVCTASTAAASLYHYVQHAVLGTHTMVVCSCNVLCISLVVMLQ
jgi:hypothetical protein